MGVCPFVPFRRYKFAQPNLRKFRNLAVKIGQTSTIIPNLFSKEFDK
jgi:hypothetical protein